MSNDIRICNRNGYVEISKEFNMNEKCNQKLPDCFNSDVTELNLINNNEVEIILNNCKGQELKLKKLNISSCSLTKLPKVICSFKYLTDLNLTNNCLEILPEEIMNLRNLNCLNLSQNKLSFLPKSLRHINQLIYLNLSNNRFFEVPEVVYFSLRNIKILDLSYNDINKFKEPPECINKLLELRLCNNSLECVPAWIFHHLCQLQILDLSDNPFRSSCKPILNYYNSGICESLKVLKIENCNYNYERLEYLAYLKNLEILCIGKKKGNNVKQNGKNYFGNLKIDGFRNLKKLKTLFLDNVSISILPKDFDCIKNVETLSAAENMLSWLPESICEFSCLKYLDLSYNQLLFLPNDIFKLVNLQQLHLRDNWLRQLPNCFSELINLEYIDLYNNELEEVDENIFNLRNLKGIDLELNNLDLNFNNSNCDGNKIKQQYNCLKNSFRNQYNCLNIRENVQKVKPEPNLEEFSCEEPTGVIRNFSISDSETNSDSEICTGNAEEQSKVSDENDWDELDSCKMEEDELFDPNKEVNTKPSAVWNENLINNFCPANNHVQSVMQTCWRNFKSASRNGIIEGQFDLD